MELNGWGVAGFFAGMFFVVLIDAVWNTNPPTFGPLLMGLMVGWFANAIGE